MPGTKYSFEVRPTLPPNLSRLDELANNLIYSWDRKVRSLFYSIDPALWERCAHNPKVFLRRVAQPRLDKLAADQTFLHHFSEVLAAYDKYLASNGAQLAGENLDIQHDRIAYFCMEYGLHESLSLYSGGLGILAGDHCKAASDLGLPLLAVGLMYRLGYFTQTIDSNGQQEAHYQPAVLENLPIHPAKDAAGQEVVVHVSIANRSVAARVWQVDVGHVRLYLLDTDLPENGSQDRAITYQLYGGDAGTRITQEIVLGIGGVRALRALGISPSAWHINEGHAAFLILERCREHVAGGLDFEAALELTAASTVFTTHTPVPAGHDVFPRDLVTLHFNKFAADMGITIERLLELGRSNLHDDGLNMTAMALRCSRRHNAVSRVHRHVAASMEGYIWPQIPAEDSPMDYVSNGVHVPTFIAREWVALLDANYPNWRNHMREPTFWARTVEDIPDHRFWSLRQSLKSEMLRDVGELLQRQYIRNNAGRVRVDSMLRVLSATNTDVLVLGFARRFVTYKRALLLFRDPQRLARLLDNPERPVIILFSGKAHPLDRPAQDMVKELYAFTQYPDFVNKVFFLEGHDIALERKLVTGVDVWLNTPEYPLEASGTSGQKAAINGVINLSILDGWWADGYDGSNGWAISPHDPSLDADYRNRIEAEELLDTLEHKVIPLYYDHIQKGYSDKWVQLSKHSMKTVLPRFNAHRMVHEYLRRFYIPAIRHGRALNAEQAQPARTLAIWKGKIRTHWPQVSLRWKNPPPAQAMAGTTASLSVLCTLDGLSATDVTLECLVYAHDGALISAYPFTPGETHGHETEFQLDLAPPGNGLLEFSVRMFPIHTLLAHRFEMGCMLWL
jgi:starch phosphorylase